MSNLGWNKRASNNKATRISYTQFFADLNGGRQSRQSRSVERPSKIPLRASSQSGRDRASQVQNKQRSKSQVPTGSTETPLNHGKFTPSQYFGSKVTPGASSSVASKKGTFYKDPRKLQDKEFIKEASQTVQTYFQEKCPEILINSTEIRPMTIKMFIAMVNYLFEVLGIHDKGIEPVRFSVSTYEKELPYWMKKLEYPGLITKAWLQTVNVPQYWPHVVALLSWLVKLCTVNSMFNMEEQLTFAPEHIDEQWAVFFFQKSMDAFRFYNEGKEDEYRELRTEVINKFRELNGANDYVAKELEAEINEAKRKQEEQDCDLQADKDAYDEAEQQLRVLQTQHEKLIDDIDRKEIFIEELKAKKVKKQKNCVLLKEEIESTKQEIERLKEVVSMQSMTVDDITEIKKKTDYLIKEIECLEKECEDYSQLLSRYELEAAKFRDKILQSSHAFNRNIIQLEQIIPELKEFHIHMDPDNQGIVEEMEKMLKSLETLRNTYVEKCQKMEEEIGEAVKNIAASQEHVKEVQKTIESLEKKNEAKSKENEKLVKSFEEKEKTLKEEADKWREKIKALEEKVKESDDLKDKKEKLKLRFTLKYSSRLEDHPNPTASALLDEPHDQRRLKRCESLNKSLKEKEMFWNEFWSKVEDKWKVIPTNLGALLEMVNNQNKELERASKLKNNSDL